MTRRRLFWLLFLALLALGVGLPVWAMATCEGWNAGSMAVTRCALDTAFVRGLADLSLGLLFWASFLGFLPVLVWLVALWLVAFVAARLAAWVLGLPPRRPRA